jgi:peptidoglycan-associated lipoprotein
MLRRQPEVVLCSVLALLAMLGGCAKRPVTTQAAAPAPSGAAAPVPVPAPVPAPPAVAVVPPAVAPAPVTPVPPAVAPIPVAPAPPLVAPVPVTPPPSAAAPVPVAPAPIAPPSPPRPEEFAEAPALRDIFFDFDKYNIRSDAARTLDTNVAWMKAHSGALVLIEGHCDERGTNAYNVALGDRRANATRDYLVARGIQASRILTVSYGEERPVCAARHETCWAKNRRAHFLTKLQ